MYKYILTDSFPSGGEMRQVLHEWHKRFPSKAMTRDEIKNFIKELEKDLKTEFSQHLVGNLTRTYRDKNGEKRYLDRIEEENSREDKNLERKQGDEQQEERKINPSTDEIVAKIKAQVENYSKLKSILKKKREELNELNQKLVEKEKEIEQLEKEYNEIGEILEKIMSLPPSENEL